MNFATTDATTFFQAFMPLVHEHWAEFPNAGEDELVLDVEAFSDCSAFVIYSDDGVGVGYAMFKICDNPYGLVPVALNIALYLKPEQRSTGLGKAFLRYIEDVLEDQLGCVKVELQFKPGRVPEGLLASLGYIPSEVRYVKKLGDETWE